MVRMGHAHAGKNTAEQTAQGSRARPIARRSSQPASRAIWPLPAPTLPTHPSTWSPSQCQPCSSSGGSRAEGVKHLERHGM